MIGRRFLGSELVQFMPFYVLVVFLTVTFLLGGGARPDVPNLIFLRPISVICLTYGAWGLKWNDVQRYGFLFAIALAIVAMVVVQLIPLPPALWHKLPGRALIVDIDHAAGLGEIWRPVSMEPLATWNALFALIGPLATLVLAAQIRREHRLALLPVLTIVGLLSGLLGFLQILGPADGPLYFYSVTNNGAAVGLFANRNHQAILLDCLFPMLAVLASVGVNTLEQRNLRLLVGSAVGLFLVPLILVTGSRAGLFIGVLAILLALSLYQRPQIKIPSRRVAKPVSKLYYAAPIIIVFMGAIAVLVSRAEAIQRLFQTDELHGERLMMWKVGWGLLWKYFPIGPGVGTIVPIYQIDEGRDVLETTYANHLHNDWLELIACGGVSAAILLIIAVIAYLRQTGLVMMRPTKDGREVLFARLGAILILVLALGSVGDYPLRTPALECVLVIAAVWLTDGRKAFLRVRDVRVLGGWSDEGGSGSGALALD